MGADYGLGDTTAVPGVTGRGARGFLLTSLLPPTPPGGKVGGNLAAPSLTLPMPDFSSLSPGLVGRSSVVVSDGMTAPAMGSGGIAVFASPMMVAVMEAAAVACVESRLPQGYVSLGTHIDVSHAAPSPVGARVTAEAELVAVSGRTLTFRVEARDEHEIIGAGTHRRVIVEAQRFWAKIAQKRSPSA
jgi:predicted thioesterase